MPERSCRKACDGRDLGPEPRATGTPAPPARPPHRPKTEELPGALGHCFTGPSEAPPPFRGPGASGALQLAAEIKRRFRSPAGGGRRTNPSWTQARLVGLSPTTLQCLRRLTRQLSRSRHVSIQPMRLAALMLEKLVDELDEQRRGALRYADQVASSGPGPALSFDCRSSRALCRNRTGLPSQRPIPGPSLAVLRLLTSPPPACAALPTGALDGGFRIQSGEQWCTVDSALDPLPPA